MKLLLGCSAIALVLVSCGGSSSTTTEELPDTDPISDDIETPDPIVTDPVEPEPDPNRVRKTKARSLDNGSVDHTISTTILSAYVTGIDFDTPDKAGAGYFDGNLAFPDLEIDGKSIDDDEWLLDFAHSLSGFDLSGVYFQYLDDEGQPVAVSGYLIDDEVAEFMETKDATLNYTYEGVSYSYAISKTDDAEAASVKDYDGKIMYSADTGTWSGVMGDVKLTGTLDGKDVKGAAELDDMKGEFSGVDGGINYTTQYIGLDPIARHDNVTAGGFSGDNGEDSAFSGAWGNLEPIAD